MQGHRQVLLSSWSMLDMHEENFKRVSFLSWWFSLLLKISNPSYFLGLVSDSIFTSISLFLNQNLL